MKAEFTKDENGTVRIFLYSYFYRYGLYMPLNLVSDLAKGRLIFSSLTIKSVRSISKIRRRYFSSLKLISKSMVSFTKLTII